MNELIADWVANGQVHKVGADTSNALIQHLEGLPWAPAGSGLDWRRLDGVSLNLSNSSDEEILECFRDLVFVGDDLLIFLLDRHSQGLACSLEFAASNFASFYWTSPGRRFGFGARMIAGEVIPSKEHVFEYDGADCVTLCGSAMEEGC